MSPTNVTLDGSILGWGHGGIARYLENVLPHMAKDPDLRIELLANSRVPVTQVEGIREHDLRVKGGVIWRSTVLQGHLLRHPPDVYWLPAVTAPPFIPHPYVVTVHDLAPAILPSSKGRSGGIAFRTAYRRAVLRADHAIAVSDSTARDLETVWSVPRERITVVPLGVSGFFTPGDREEALANVRTRFGLSEPFALVVGTVEERKGLGIAVEIQRNSAALKVVFAGRKGFGHETVVARGESAGAIFLGEIDDSALLDLYRSAEVLLLPSKYEGFGLSPLEAMACGCPVVLAGAAGSLDDLYADAAEVVAERSVDAWLRAIDDVREGREKRVTAGYEVAGRYSWEACASATGRVLRDVARTGRRSPR
jgi:glycosyltransferase involved in cell wall biosynthesis